MIAREALAKIRELHSDSGQRTTHWCSHFGGSTEPDHGPGPNSCEECGSEMAWPCDTRKLADAVSADEGLIEDIATMRDAETDPLRRYRYNVAIAVLAEIAGVDMDIASENRTAVLDSYLQINLHEQEHPQPDDSELPPEWVAEMKRRIAEPGETIRMTVAEMSEHLEQHSDEFHYDPDDEHGLMSPPIDGEDAMFWTPECHCGAPWPCPYVQPLTETPDEVHRQDRDG